MRMLTLALSALTLLGLCTCLTSTAAADPKPFLLPKPQTDGGMPLMKAIKERKTIREFSSEELPPQTLSNLLWAAFGINRPDSGRRTAPSALNRQEIDVYVATRAGVFLYDARDHLLVPVSSEDVRALTGTQSYFRDAPVNLIYVADMAKMGESEDMHKVFLSAADTGFISQNVYLFCASEGLATVVRASIDRPRLAEAMKLRSDQRITLAQTVGLPKSK